MRPDCQLRAFNVEVIGSPTMILSPCSQSCPPTLATLFGDNGEGCGRWRITLSSQDTSSPRTCCSSAISSSSFGPSLVILGRFPPRLGPWAYYLKWIEVPRFFGLTTNTVKVQLYSSNSVIPFCLGLLVLANIKLSLSTILFLLLFRTDFALWEKEESIKRRDQVIV